MLKDSQADRFGFSLTEVLVTLVLGGLVLGSATRLVLGSSAAVSRDLQRAVVSSDLRIGSAVIASELRGLGYDRLNGSDLLVAGRRFVVYRAMRSLYFVCAAWNPGQEILVEKEYFGARSVQPENDSAFVFDGVDWYVADIISVGSADCTDGTPGLRLGVSLPTTPDSLAIGHPVRVFDTNWLGLYRSDEYWLGSARRSKLSGRWGRRQPVVGPFGSGGLEFEYVERDGRSVGVDFTLTAEYRGQPRILSNSVAFRN